MKRELIMEKKIRNIALIFLFVSLLTPLVSNSVNPVPASATVSSATIDWSIPNGPCGELEVNIDYYKSSNYKKQFRGVYINFHNIDPGVFYPSVRVITGIYTRIRIYSNYPGFQTIDTGYRLYHFYHLERLGWSGIGDWIYYTTYHPIYNHYDCWANSYQGADHITKSQWVQYGQYVTVEVWMKVIGFINSPDQAGVILAFGPNYPYDLDPIYYRWRLTTSSPRPPILP